MTKVLWNDCIGLARTINNRYSLTEEQQRLLFDCALTIPSGGVIMELGTCHGKTSAVLAYVAKHKSLEFHGIDDFSLEGSESEFRAGLEKLVLPYTLHVGKTQKISWDRELDLLVVDAGHDPVNVRADCDRWISFVKPGGYVAFHDYPEPFNRKSAHWAVRFFADEYTNEWDDVGFVRSGRDGKDGLKVRQKPLAR